MNPEIEEIIEVINETWTTKGPMRIKHTEDGIMHTIAIGNQIFKGIKTEDGWSVNKLK